MALRWLHAGFVITIIAVAWVEQLQLSSAQPTCGYQANYALCPSNLCCSQYGYCGSTSLYCGDKCQSGPCSPPAGISPGHILFDYIGSNGVDIAFSDYPVNTSTDITYILGLAFAIDSDSYGNTQNGNFLAYWYSGLTAAAAKSWRSQYPNVRISIAIGGYEVYDPQGNAHLVNWYNPANATEWLANAVASMTKLVQAYGADGIDIDIENFPSGSTNFVALMGGLVKTLKDTGVIKFASCAPGYDQLPLYTALYNAYPTYFDFFNYQFYGDVGLDTTAEYLARYNQVIAQLPAAKIAPSTQVNDSATIPINDFYTVVQNIRASHGIPGVVLWNADISKNFNNFGAEKAISGFL